MKWDDIFSYPLEWVESIREEIESYEYWLKQSTQLSRKRQTEHIQRALEKSIKFPFLIIGEMFDFIDPLLNEIFQLKEFNDTFNKEYIDKIRSEIKRFKRFTNPKNLTHIPSNEVLPIINEISINFEKGSKIRSHNDQVIEAIIEGGHMAKIDAEYYNDFADIMVEYISEVYKDSQVSREDDVSLIINKTNQLIDKIPDYNLLFLPYAATSLKLTHTLLGLLSLFTPLKEHKNSIKKIDEIARTQHNRLAYEKMDSIYFKMTYGFYVGIIKLLSLFPLGVYLGLHYENHKYPSRGKDQFIDTYNNKAFSEVLQKSVTVMKESVQDINSFLDKISEVLIDQNSMKLFQ